MLPRIVLASALLPAALAAQQPIPGYAPRTAERQRTAEAAAVQTPSPEFARRHSRALTAEPHVAGDGLLGRQRGRQQGCGEGDAWEHGGSVVWERQRGVESAN
ncbi:MAG TPA: hypothetical protein VM759_00280 [Longimicrobium sp.]|nr:hypothetical protein [Longimicrobium sp.]